MGLFFNNIVLSPCQLRGHLLGLCWALPMENVGFPIETVCCALGLTVPVEVPMGHSRSGCSLHHGLGGLRCESLPLQGNGSRSGFPSLWMGHESC